MSDKNLLIAFSSAYLAHAAFNWQVKLWSRWIPKKVGGKGRDQLLKEQENVLIVAKILGIIGVLVGVMMYVSKMLSDHDWRGLGIGMGLAVVLPTLYIIMANANHGREGVKEGMIAYAIKQRTPPKVVFWMMGVLSFFGAVSAISLLLRR